MLKENERKKEERDPKLGTTPKVLKSCKSPQERRTPDNIYSAQKILDQKTIEETEDEEEEEDCNLELDQNQKS
jgi:hypothetical protein